MGDDRAGVGSVLLLPEVLRKPLRDGASAEVAILAGLLSRLYPSTLPDPPRGA